MIRTSVLAENVNAAASSASTPLDFEREGRSYPMLPSSTVVAAVSLDGVTRARIVIETSESASFPSSDRKTLLDLNLTTQTVAETRVTFKPITPSARYIRIRTTAAAGATGRVSADLLG